MCQLALLSSLCLLVSTAFAAPTVTRRPTFRIDGTERILFIYTGDLIVAIISVVAAARIIIACIGLCCVGNQERFYYREVIAHVFALSEEDKKKREPIDSIASAMRCTQEYLEDREAKCLEALAEFKSTLLPAKAK